MRRVLAAALALAAVVLLPAPAKADAGPTPPPECYRGPNENAYYKITNAGTGRVLDVEHHSKAYGAAIIQWPYSGAANQQWRAMCVAPFAYKFVSRDSGLVLDVTAGSTEAGARVQQWGYAGSTNQQWYLGQAGNAGGLITYELQNRRSSNVLDVAPNGLGIQQSPSDPADLAQQWTFEQVGTVS